MERLTIRNNVGLDVLKSPVVCGRCGEVDYSPITESGEDVAKRLAAYEDTGLEPEDCVTDSDALELRMYRRIGSISELRAIKERYQALGPVEELSALVKAQDEGRAVELDTPRKPLVWGDDDHDTCLCPDCGADLMGLHYGERIILQCPVCGQYLDTTKAITRAEAEAALGGGGDG